MEIDVFFIFYRVVGKLCIVYSVCCEDTGSVG